ncbi:hypothetical protein M011DRAFT_457986 [Sporormia fimetaria CBS 119925]|uniref:RRM domain-containing protein n=1 Tax=Sporormia fimetaria CBS 119925 TaxID=1340428 RepID=A0A6A6VBR9_9PLEO|nr:hypothetical protein M011DRAFT_457986 [Sporormia fimetaria CBS 119925]
MAETNFADFIKQARDKKKKETLAQEILGSRGRKAAGSGAAPKARNGAEKPSLVSRMSSSSGVNKSRSSSAKPAAKPAAANINDKWEHDLHGLNNPQASKKTARGASATQIDRNTRTFNKFRSVLQDNVPAAQSSGFNIKGVATGGPFTVIASNFANGTTAADIEAVMAPVVAEREGSIVSCRLISANPTVMVELVIDKRDAAQNVIDIFNNKKADGRLLYVYLKDTPNPTPTAPASSTHRLNRAPQPVHDDMDVDMNNGERSGSFQDGRYGFREDYRAEPPRGPRRRY